VGKVKHNWDKTIDVVKELVGETDSLKALRFAVSARTGEEIAKSTFKDGLERELDIQFDGIEELRHILLSEEDLLTPFEGMLLRYLRKRGRTRAISLLDICNRFDKGPSSVLNAAESLRGLGFNIQIDDDRTNLALPATVPQSGWTIPVDEYFDGTMYRFGVISDVHIGNRSFRLDVLEALYDIFESEGIKAVLLAGNLVDGESRLNAQELVYHGVEGQLMAVVRMFPKRKGIVTKFITADDHEGWWCSNIGLDVGRYMHSTFLEEGRSDLQWIGHVEADLELDPDNPRAILRVVHPGGGTAYALSYTFQKWVESLQGGEKPAIAILGHFHKYVAGYPRNVWALEPGCVCDQTLWMRKRRIEAHVGGCIVEIQMTGQGGIGYVDHRFMPFYDKGYYQSWDYRSMFEQETMNDL
jgi:predicted phosphodiesterase